jgi:hypothetical protein
MHAHTPLQNSTMLKTNQVDSFNQNGYLIIENFIDSRQRHRLMQRAEQLIEEFQPPTNRSVFTTN